MKLFAGVLAAALLSISPALAADNLIGTWVLNVAKSKMAFLPASETMTVSDLGGGKFKSAAVIVVPNVPANHMEVVFAFDGKDYPLTATPPIPGMETVTEAFRRVDANTIVVSLKTGGKLVSSLTNVLSADGKTLTVTQPMPGGAQPEIGVFERK